MRWVRSWSERTTYLLSVLADSRAGSRRWRLWVVHSLCLNNTHGFPVLFWRETIDLIKVKL